MYLPNPMFQTRSFLNFFEISNSAIRRPCTHAMRDSVKPSIFTPLIEESIEEVDEMRLSIASSHMAWRDITKDSPIKDPTSATVNRHLDGYFPNPKCIPGLCHLPIDTATGITHAIPSCLSRRNIANPISTAFAHISFIVCHP